MTKYDLIADEMRSRIYNQFYPDDQPIPDEMSLAREFSCSRMTMKKALEILVHEGLLYRKRGSGTFIIKSALKNGRVNVTWQATGLTENVKSKQVTSVIIEFSVGFPDQETIAHLNIEPTTPVYKIIRLRKVDDEPYVIERTFMPITLIPGLNEQVLSGSVYRFIKEELGLSITSSHKTIRADKPNPLDREYLNCAADDPILEVEQVVYLHSGQPFEYSFARHRYDKFEFTAVHIKR